MTSSQAGDRPISLGTLEDTEKWRMSLDVYRISGTLRCEACSCGAPSRLYLPPAHTLLRRDCANRREVIDVRQLSAGLPGAFFPTHFLVN